MRHAVRVFCLIMVWQLLAAPVAALTTKIDAKQEFCVREMVGKDVPLALSFQVTAGGKLDIDATIYDGTGRKIHGWDAATEGHYEMRGDASNTRFRICFSNKLARFTPKWVAFFLHKGVHPAVASVEHLDPIEKSVLALAEKMGQIRDLEGDLKNLEREHRDTIEDTNERVWLWSALEALALFVVGLLQVFFMKRFLEVRSSV